MNYDIPADTVRFVNGSKTIAIQYRLQAINLYCLLLSLLSEANEATMRLVEMDVNLESLLSKIYEKLTEESDACREEQPTLEPPMDADCTRIFKLMVLENRLSGGRRSGAELLVLAILHDRNNVAKTLLHNAGVTYERMVKNETKDRPIYIIHHTNFTEDEKK